MQSIPPVSASLRGARRKAREDAVQILYLLDLNTDLSPQAAMFRFELCFQRDGKALHDFTQRLVLGVTNHLRELDTAIAHVAENWRPDRMPIVDRNILRLGAYELEYCDDIPATVSINEMIELAKQYGSEQSPSFINGILDKIKAKLNRPEKAP